MSVVQLDIQKIEQLLNSATTSRQRKMYQALLDKALSQQRADTDSKAPLTTPETRTARVPELGSGDVSSEKKTQTPTNQKTETKTKTKTTKKQKKSTRKSATKEVSTPTTEQCKPILESSTLPQSSDLPSKTSLPFHTSEPQQQQPDASPPIFQALGTILAAPYIKGDRLKVAINDCEYDLLYTRGFQRQAYRSLSSELEKNGSSQMFLKLYPNVTFSPKSVEPSLSFLLVSFNLDFSQRDDYPEGFVLRGIWQYIPHCSFPVISIYRNFNQLPAFKKLNKSQQFSFAKPHHIPVVWDAPVEPFKYNPQLEKDLQMPRYFVEVRAIFKDGLYVVEEMLREPTLDIPKYIKLPKKKLPSIS